MKVLFVELWGLGDAVMMTTALQPLLASGAKVSILCKRGSVELLKPSYPQVEFIVLDAPWTAFTGKYRLGSWPWRDLFRIVRAFQNAKFDAAASVRNDPRDHLLMFLAGARRRVGFPRRGSGVLLTHALTVKTVRDHRVDNWRQIAAAILPSSVPETQAVTASAPRLNPGVYVQHEESRQALAQTGKKRPVVALHCGARIAVRRWDESSFARIIQLLRQEADFHLALFPDVDGYGRTLIPLADSCHEAISISELAADLAACDLLLCNDSGPAHIASALGRPVLAIFGPTNPNWFRPYGEQNHIVIRDICPYRPCFDYCRFPEPICLTQLRPVEVWPEIRSWMLPRLKDNGTNPLNPV